MLPLHGICRRVDSASAPLMAPATPLLPLMPPYCLLAVTPLLIAATRFARCCRRCRCFSAAAARRLFIFARRCCYG